MKRQIDEGRTEVFDVYDLAVILWRQKVFKIVSGVVTESVLRLIKRERQGVRLIINMCVLLLLLLLLFVWQARQSARGS